MLQSRPVLALVLLSALCSAVACDSGPAPGEEAVYWGEKLNTENDMPKREAALQHLAELKDKKALPALFDALKQTGAAAEMRPKIAELIGMIGDASAVEPLVNAIDWSAGAGRDRESRAAAATNEKITKALGKIGVGTDKKVVDALVRLADNNSQDVQLAAVVALGELRAVDAVDKLVEIADGHANNFMVKNAVEALGKLGAPKAARVLGKLMFFERAGVSFYRESSYALFLLGKDSVPVLNEMYEGNFKDIEELHIEPGVQKTKAVVVYGDLVLPETNKKVMAGVDMQGNDTSTALLRTESQRAVGRMGLKEAVPSLIKRMDNVDISQSEHALAALTQIGETSAADAIYNISTSDGFLKNCKAQGNPEDQCKFSEVQIRKPRVLAFSRLSRDDAKMKKLVADEKNEEFKKWLGEQAERVAAAAECKGDIACLKGKLEDKNARVRERAAYELAWAAGAGDDGARDALIEALDDEDNEARYAAIFGIGRRLPKDGAALAERLTKQLETEKGKTQFIKVNEDLKRLVVRVARGY